MQLGKLFDESETDAHATLAARAARIGLSENFENVGQKLGRNSLTTVFNSQPGVFTVSPECNLHLAIYGRKLDGVVEQIPCDLAQANRIAFDYEDLRI